MAQGSRQDQSLVTVTVDGIALGTFEVRTGGATTSSDTRYGLGGMGPMISLGGNRQVENVTVRALMTDVMRAQKSTLRGKVGSGKAVVVDQALDADANATGEPDVYSGTLIRFTPPDSDRGSDAAATFELEISVDGDVG